MNNEIERNLGPQPFAGILESEGLTPHRLVETNPVAITHKLVSRGAKGRRLTRHSQQLLLEALNKTASRAYVLSELFDY